MSFSIYCIKYFILFAVYFLKQIFYTNIFYFEINCIIIWLSLIFFIIFFCYKQQIIEENISNYSPNVMFRETPCTSTILEIILQLSAFLNIHPLQWDIYNCGIRRRHFKQYYVHSIRIVFASSLHCALYNFCVLCSIEF